MCSKAKDEIWRQIHKLIEVNGFITVNGWDTKDNQVSIWECEKPILKTFDADFTPYPHSLVNDFEAILAPHNEHPTDNLNYLWRHTSISVAIHVTLGGELVHLVDENPERLIESFIKVLAEKQETPVPFRFSSTSKGRWKKNERNGIISPCNFEIT